MLQELTRCFRSIGEDAEARSAILRANGPAFSGGHDIGEMAGKIFRIGILRTGQPPKLIEMIKWATRRN